MLQLVCFSRWLPTRTGSCLARSPCGNLDFLSSSGQPSLPPATPHQPDFVQTLRVQKGSLRSHSQRVFLHVYRFLWSVFDFYPFIPFRDSPQFLITFVSKESPLATSLPWVSRYKKRNWIIKVFVLRWYQQSYFRWQRTPVYGRNVCADLWEV